VPASIAAESSSDDVIVKEGDTVVLTCNATGIPQPEVTWYRRSSLAFKLGQHAKRTRKYSSDKSAVILADAELDRIFSQRERDYNGKNYCMTPAQYSGRYIT